MITAALCRMSVFVDNGGNIKLLERVHRELDVASVIQPTRLDWLYENGRPATRLRLILGQASISLRILHE